MTEVLHLRISGRVQGVGFRYLMTAQANLLGVCGWVRNRRDGSVEAMVAGTPEQLEQMLAWTRVGPAEGSVDTVTNAPGKGEFTSFEILPTA